MPTPEPARHAMYSELERVLGADHADTLMTYLPQHRADEVATKADIAVLEGRFDRLDDRFDRLEDRVDRFDDRFDRLEDRFDRFDDRFDRLDGRFDNMHAVVRDQQRFFVAVSFGTMAALTAIFSVVVGLIT